MTRPRSRSAGSIRSGGSDRRRRSACPGELPDARVAPEPITTAPDTAPPPPKVWPEPSAKPATRFAVLVCTALTDAGATLDLPALATGKSWKSEITVQALTLSVVATEGLASFRTEYGLAADGADDAADADDDGLPNLLEFALGGDPTVASTSEVPVLTSDGTDLILVFERPDSAEADLTYTVQSSTDFSTWTDHIVGDVSGTSSGATITIEENGDEADTVTVSIPISGARAFARLRVEVD